MRHYAVKICGPMVARAGIGAVVLLALVGGGSGLRCANQRHAEGVAEGGATKPIPAAPLKGQARGPCRKFFKEINGGCWNAVLDPDTGKQLTGCMNDEEIFEDNTGKCWTPIKVKKKRRPSATDPGVIGDDEFEGMEE